MKKILGIIGIVLVIIAGAGLGFLFTAGVVKLISMCFGFAFSWKIALGVWLAMVLIKAWTTASKRMKS